MNPGSGRERPEESRTSPKKILNKFLKNNMLNFLSNFFRSQR